MATDGVHRKAVEAYKKLEGQAFLGVYQGLYPVKNHHHFLVDKDHISTDDDTDKVSIRNDDEHCM